MARRVLRLVLNGRHAEEARIALRRSRRATDEEARRAVLVIAPDYAALRELRDAEGRAFEGARTRGLMYEGGEVTIYAVPRAALAGALNDRWWRDLPALERACDAAEDRGEVAGVLLTRVRSVAASGKAVGA